MDNSLNIGVAYATSAQLATAQKLAQHLALPLSVLQDDFEYLLTVTEQGLELRPCYKGAPGALFVDFLAGKNAFRSQEHNLKTEMLYRAVQIKHHPQLTIIDATAGLGRDAFLLARLGHTVTLIERSPIVSALLSDGLARLKLAMPEILMNLIQLDAVDYLQQLPTTAYPDIIYLDPMFPPRTKSALVKKDMQLLQQLVGHGGNNEALFSKAQKIAKHRVIVKRPRLSPHLGNHLPTYSLEGKASRFDIYQTPPKP